MSATELPLSLIDAIVVRALEEDLGAGDVTTEACVPEGAQATGHGVARKVMVVAGLPVAERVFLTVDPTLKFTAKVAEGAKVEGGAVLYSVVGRARSLLTAERVSLNLIQRMCGIATATRRYVDALPAGSKTRITDTRKTTPGLRLLERYAVRRGGGHNHRNDLGSAVLIKDNHIVAAGGVRQAIEAARARAPHTSKIECEVDSLEQLEEALSAGADIVLLDNMDTETTEEAVRRTRGRALLEASGGITEGRIAELARAGVDAISVGALTHSTPAADIGFDFVSAK
ncbi:MAG: carboxylating nicotinate-nucleotide diphosphorylase [Labilithrix sp.]|nr:carboxylating nicotinate-nucleotide diphosphorylase [Labilithrix sp.]MCW5817944.1 carboxylating nicotinate-nucleotide diphosphorylase [Labilithrix sp.]